MPKKSVVLLVGVLVVGVLVALWRNGNETPSDIPVVQVGEEAISSPIQPSIPEPTDEPIPPVDVVAVELMDKKPAQTLKKPNPTDYAKFRPAVREVLGGDSYNDRLRSVKYDLPENLDGREYQGLRSYLLNPQNGKDGDFRQHEYALRNYMMDALRGEGDRLGETIGAFVSVYGDEAQGEVMRNYALQHLASVYIDNTSTLSGGDKSRIVKTLKAALNDTSGETLTGTALVGLQDISRWDAKTVSPASVGSAALKLLQSGDSGTLSKISAFQIGGELKLKSIGTYAREAAFDADADWVLRMSAVYALGQLGETAGLETLLNDSDKYVRKAALAALNVKR